MSLLLLLGGTPSPPPEPTAIQPRLERVVRWQRDGYRSRVVVVTRHRFTVADGVAGTAPTVTQPRLVRDLRWQRDGYRTRVVVQLRHRFAVRDGVVTPTPPVATVMQRRTIPQGMTRQTGGYRASGGTRLVRRFRVQDGVVTPPAGSSLSGWLLLLGVGA